jgi:hemerythrin
MTDIQVKAYMLGIPKIDAQHTKFFQLNQSIHEYIDSHDDGFDPRQLLILLLQFRKYAFNHFYTEESMMLDKKYPGFFDQKEAHNKFVLAIIEYEDKVELAYHEVCESMKKNSASDGKPVTNASPEEAGEFVKLANELCAFVSDWYTKHILEMDKGYVDYLK